MGRKKVILVLGWYGHGNLGDEAFKTSFRTLWPQFEFRFSDSVPKDWSGIDGVFVGGGSLLDEWQFKGLEKAPVPLAFIGVGAGATVTDPSLKSCLQKSKMNLVRDALSTWYVPNWRRCPDLVWANPFLANPRPIGTGKVTVIVNDHVSPKYGDEGWKSDAWNWLAHEMAGCVQDLLEAGLQVQFVPMCTGAIDDRRAAADIVSRLKHPERVKWSVEEAQEQLIHNAIAESDLVITQRFHGMIYAAQAGKPFVAVSAHDKINSLYGDLLWGAVIPAYGLQKSQFKAAVDRARNSDPERIAETVRMQSKTWADLSANVAELFFA